MNFQEFKDILKTHRCEDLKGHEFIIDSHDELMTRYLYILHKKNIFKIETPMIIDREWLAYKELICELDGEKHFILAIDGMIASGKTTLSHLIKQLFDASVIHMDDFYQPIERRTDDVAGNINIERLIDDVVVPIQKKKNIEYRRFLCQSQSYDQTKIIPYTNGRYVIEGTYALIEQLNGLYSHRIFLNITTTQRIERITARSKNRVQQFIEQWIPREEAYIERYQLRNQEYVLNKSFFID